MTRPGSGTTPKDKATAIYHVVLKHEGLEESGRSILTLIQKAQTETPGKKRVLYLDIDGHRNTSGGFDNDMLILQRDVIVATFMPFLSDVHLPLGNYENSGAQRNDVPDEMDFVYDEKA